MFINMTELAYFKNLARKEGSRGRIIEELPVQLRKSGLVAEIAVMGLLGLTQQYLGKKGTRFYIEVSSRDDIRGVDFTINGNPVQLKSKMSYQSFHNFEDCMVIYDDPGIANLAAVIEYIGMQQFFVEPEFRSEVNRLWSMYMKTYKVLENNN